MPAAKDVKVRADVGSGRAFLLNLAPLGEAGRDRIDSPPEARSWTDKNGTERRSTEIIAENIQLGPKRLSKDEPAPKVDKSAPVAARTELAEETSKQHMNNGFNLDILQALYDSEINCELRWIWDAASTGSSLARVKRFLKATRLTSSKPRTNSPAPR